MTEIFRPTEIFSRTGIFTKKGASVIFISFPYRNFLIVAANFLQKKATKKINFSKKSKFLFGVSEIIYTFAVEIKSNNIMTHQYQSNYKPNEFLDVLDEFFNGKLKCQISTYSERGRVKVKTISLGRDAIEGQWANFHRI